MSESFKTLRTWNGEQSRAFEELSFQLLKDKVPSGMRAIRTGNPDGGVEWYATLHDGTEWGWQAKHVHGIDALLTAMTGSVERVAKERPSLRKLTFVISWNLATSKAGKGGRERKSQRQKYEDKIKTWQQTIPGAEKIEFDLVQESDLLDELAKPAHNGRRWFWWGDLVFGRDWLETRYKQQAAAASEKYRPDLQVDVPIEEDLLALGFDQSIRTFFDRHVRDIISAVADVRVWTKDDDETATLLYQTISEAATTLRTTAEALALQAGDPPAALEPLLAAVAECQNAIYAAEEYERKLEAEWRELANDNPQKANKPSERTSSYSVRGLASAMNELVSWLESSVGRSFRRRAYFLTGQAGSGKTHLLLDATRRALDSGRPAVFLAGAQFGQGNLWASIADQLGLEAVGADVLLRAMDAAGEAASTRGSRFVIFLDALNETTPPDFWRVHLPTLRAAIAPYPHVALAVSCRDTYKDLVLEGAEGTHYVRRTHPGFAEREVEATQRYFAHYQLEAPKIPLLTPEFTLPLFLRLYCESLSQAETGVPIPDGHQGRIAIFERYLAVKIATVARRFRPAASSSYELNAAKFEVRRVLDGLLDELSQLGRESMSTGAAEAVARASLGDTSAEGTRILGLLQEEGVLTRERLYLGSGNFAEGVRIVFQAFADFLLLKRRLALSDDPLNDPALRSWLTEECSWGISEAATILFPEVHSIELPDLLGIKLGAEPKQHEDEVTWDRHHRARNLYRSLVEMLPYRESQAISQRTIDLLNEAQRYLSRDEFYRILFTLAPQPGNRLNGDGLHRYLLKQRMPRRDADFGFATYHELFETFSPAARLARWAAAGPYPEYGAEVIELASIPLCWLLSSPNRFMRDWVTKALVQLLRGHLDVMRALVERFWTVDDPYVVQRVIAIAYGSLLRSTSAQAEQAKALAEAVNACVFARPVRPDELLLDAARGVVRWAVAHQLLPGSALDSAQRPYGLKPPGSPPTEATIKAKYGWHKDQPDDESYSSISFSLLSMGDFGRYVVESGLHHFSRYRMGQEYPEREYRKPRFIKSRWTKFVASLRDDQKEALADWLRDPEENKMGRISFLLRREDDPLSDEQRKLLDAVFVYPKPINDEYPADRACRWVFRRTLSLGWTPKLFGHKDRTIGHGRGREGHKAERWGKKYQWMAYHELLARVADNYQASRSFGDSEPYEGLHQIIGEREIDPSLPPIDFRAFSESDGNGVTAWSPPLIQLEEWPPARLDFGRYRGDIRRFLADTTSEPTVSGSMFVRDCGGNDWVVLESFVKKVDPLAYKGWRGLQEHSAIDTLLVTAADSKALLAALPDEPRHEIRDLIDSHGHTDCCYVGEVGRVGPTCYHRHDQLRQVSVGDKSFQVVATVEQYAWEGNILDCSIGETASTVLPSTFIQQAAGLSFDMRGPSWLDAGGAPVFTYYEEEGNGSRALLVRATFLREFLTTHKLDLVALHWFERMELSDNHDGKHPYVESTSDARLASDLTMHIDKERRTERDLS
ncbi:ATP-binding protein [Amycolatopsis sp. NPDC051128]|uniref:ATP-binding protein n=1 Tax=Amycolatopsis sp. NPDC051128 TaxID=3155412 RepID=UPI00342B2382